VDESRFKLDDFELYQLAREFRKGVYQLIKRLPPGERYCLAPQMRRATLSVSTNVAEGHGRWHFQDNIRFCPIARGSVDEVIDDLNVCLDEAYAPHYSPLTNRP
jgi:four helix bundle protein